MKVERVTLIVPFYRQVAMLREQIAHWNRLPDGYRIILVDDGSPEAAAPVVRALADLSRVKVYRVATDIPWNRGGARNLATLEADTDWIIHVDTDHVLPAPCAVQLLKTEVDPARWYRFPRFRVGRADETRRKDAIAPDSDFGQIKPHCDSYLCTRELYWKAGGYNEDFSGCLGGGTPFLGELSKAGEVDLLPEDVHLHVYTRDRVPDASISTLSRDTSEFTRRKRAMNGQFRGSNPIRFPWSRVL